MPKRGVRGRGGRRKHRAARIDREWIGGRLTPPFFVTDRDDPYRPDLVIWLDTRDSLVVGQDVVGPEDVDALGRVLLAAIERPLAGRPRRPDRIRVADADLAAEIRATLGDETPILVAPTPEFDELLETMLDFMPDSDEEDSYFEYGRVSFEALAEFFQAAEILYGLAPWQVATDDQVLRMDIPALSVYGACVAIIGNLGHSLGVLIFPSLDSYEAFGRAADDPVTESGHIDLGTDWLALSFERGADLPAPMRREVAAHGWPVADANAYPRVLRIERDGMHRPLVERDVQIAAACATSLAAFFAKHRGLFERDAFEPVCESYFDGRDLEVRFTLPFEAFALFDVHDVPQRPPDARHTVRRNDPCPCGSGKKYKKCHLPLDEAERARSAKRSADHDLDGQLVGELSGFALDRFGLEWSGFMDDFVDAAESLQLSGPWSVYHYQVRGRSILEWYLAERVRQLSRTERDWFAVQQTAWLSVWEVVDLEPGQSVTLRDLLSHEERCVREASGSQTLKLRDALLARVVDHDGVSLLCGVHPRVLSPGDAAEVVRRARGRLRRKRAVPLERLRPEAFGRYLIQRWEETVFAAERRAAIPPELHNTDGDAFLFTTDHFAFEPAARAEIRRRLTDMERVEADESDSDFVEFVFLAPGNAMHTNWDNTLVGRAVLLESALRLETNSRQRADALRERVETACDGLLRHRAREHSDPLSPAVNAGESGGPREAPPPEAAQLVLDFKRRHYASWPDQPLPALDGLSPREASKTAQGRGAVDVLLKEMENMEQRNSGREAFDFSGLRRELRLE